MGMEVKLCNLHLHLQKGCFMKFSKIFFFLSILVFDCVGIYSQSVINTPIEKLKGHTENVEALSYSPDGKFLVSTGWDRTLRVWDTETWTEIKNFIAHDAPVSCVSYSRDGKYVISGARDNSIRIWDSAWNVKYNLFGHQNTINAVLMGPKMKYAYSGGADGMVKLWDLAKKGESKTLITMPRPVNALAINLTGTEVYVATEGPDIIALTLTGTTKQTYTGHTDEVNDIQYSLNNKYLVSGSSDKTAIIWDVLTGKEIHTLKGHSWKVTNVAISSDSKFVVTGSTDGTIKLWEVETGNLIYTYENRVNAITSLDLSPDISRIASAAMVNSDAVEKFVIYIWDTKQELERNRLIRLKKEREDSILKVKDSVIKAKDSVKKVQDSLKKVEKLKQEQNKPQNQQPDAPTPDTGRSLTALPTKEEI